MADRPCNRPGADLVSEIISSMDTDRYGPSNGDSSSKRASNQRDPRKSRSEAKGQSTVKVDPKKDKRDNSQQGAKRQHKEADQAIRQSKETKRQITTQLAKPVATTVIPAASTSKSPVTSHLTPHPSPLASEQPNQNKQDGGRADHDREGASGRDIQNQLDVLTQAMAAVLPIVTKLQQAAQEKGQENTSEDEMDTDDIHQETETVTTQESPSGNEVGEPSQHANEVIPPETEAEDPPSQNAPQENPSTVDNLLQALSDALKTQEQCSAPVDSTLAEKINTLMSSGVSDDKISDLKEKYSRPENCNYLLVPKCQPEVWSHASDSVRSRDLKLQRVQSPVTKAMTAITGLVNDIMAAVRGQQAMPSGRQLLQTLSDSLSLLACANAELNTRRKETWRAEMSDSVRPICSGNRPVTEFLFGNDLPSTVKELADTQRITNLMKKRTSDFRKANRFNPTATSTGHFKSNKKQPFLAGKSKNYPRQNSKSNSWSGPKGRSSGFTHKAKGYYNHQQY